MLICNECLKNYEIVYFNRYRLHYIFLYVYKPIMFYDKTLQYKQN